MSPPPEKFAAQVNSEILTTVRALADTEGGQLISRYCGSPALRDRWLLETALYRPQTNGGRLTAGAEETYAFVSTLYQSNQFHMHRLVSWLRDHVTQEAG